MAQRDAGLLSYITWLPGLSPMFPPAKTRPFQPGPLPGPLPTWSSCGFFPYLCWWWSHRIIDYPSHSYFSLRGFVCPLTSLLPTGSHSASASPCPPTPHILSNPHTSSSPVGSTKPAQSVGLGTTLTSPSLLSLISLAKGACGSDWPCATWLGGGPWCLGECTRSLCLMLCLSLSLSA